MKLGNFPLKPFDMNGFFFATWSMMLDPDPVLVPSVDSGRLVIPPEPAAGPKGGAVTRALESVS
jgi:hypothetical protein